MRLIDADEFLELESEAYMLAQIELAKKNTNKTIDTTRYINELVHKKIQMLIKDAPTVDAVEVVKEMFCDDCKGSKPQYCEYYGSCKTMEMLNKAKHFGERKDNGRTDTEE